MVGVSALKRENANREIKPTGVSSELSPQEGFLLSRIGDKTKLQELFALAPWPEDETLQILENLFRKNALEWVQLPPEDAPVEIVDELNHDDQDPVYRALDRSFRREILVHLDGIQSKNPYEILDVPRNATQNDIRASYLNLSKRFHPDRFFRKPIGKYKQKLDFLFAQIQKSYASLKDPHERERVDRMIQLQRSGKKGRSKDEILKTVRALNPELEKLTRAEKYFHEGQELKKSGDFLSAYNSFALASQTNPEKASYKKALEDVRPLMVKQKAEARLKDATNAWRLQLYEDAARFAWEALQMDGELADAQLFWAKAVIELKQVENYLSARQYLLRAKAKLARSADPCYWLARISLLLGEDKNAKKSLEEALKRDPRHILSQKLLEEL